MFQLEFRDAPDSYKPVTRSLWEFLQQKQSLLKPSANIETFYQSLCTHEMNVFIHETAEEHLKEHLRRDSSTETGGVLVGEAYFCQETKSHYTEIVDAIPAINTVGNRVHFEFTSESWKEIYKIRERDFPENVIVGWYHSHPGHGIFLSATDLTTQRSCYNQIWQIAVVYDPLNQQIGFFYGADGKRIDPIYMEKYSPQLQWRDPPSSQPQEQGQIHARTVELFPVTSSEPVQDRSESATSFPRKPESHEQPEGQGQNPGIVILDIALKIIVLPISLLNQLIAKIFPSHPQNSQAPDSPQSSEPPKSESQPPESQPAQPK